MLRLAYISIASCIC